MKVPPKVVAYGKRLDIDLSSGKIIKRNIDPEFARTFMGGMGFSCKILYDQVLPEVDPLGPDNLLIIANGTLTGTNAVCAARTEITTKSPLTGHLGTGNTGGNWGTYLKRAGFGLVVIKGKAKNPVYIWINDGKVELKDANHLWGKGTYETTQALERELNPLIPSQVKVLAIGPAGENLVKFACPMNDYYHCAARCGAGAVMGAKKLKAIAVQGTGIITPVRKEEFRVAAEKARRNYLKCEKAIDPFGHEDKPHIDDVRLEVNITGKNFQTGVLPDWNKTRGDKARRKYLTGLLGVCHGCLLRCSYGAELKEGKYAGLKVSRAMHGGVVTDFGGKCAIDNLPAIWKCKQLCNQLGLDYATVASVIAFAMELYQRGIITKEDTGGLELSWGNEDAAIELIHKIAVREGFGDILAEGSVKAAKKIGKGAEKYVMATKGMDLMAMDLRSADRGYTFGYLTNPRGGDNLKTTHFATEKCWGKGWWVDDFDMFEDVKRKVYKLPKGETRSTWEGKPTMAKWFEDLYSAANALGICFFSAGLGVLGPGHLSELYSAFTGIQTTPEELMRIGGNIFTVLKAYTVREGLTRKDDTLPDRFFTEALADGPNKGAVLSKEEIDKLLDEYYELRGWDKETSIPTNKKLAELGLV
jgi:aldehyde:ferredoxin oxidoreductase